MKSPARICFFIGPLLLLLTWVTDSPIPELPNAGWKATGLTALMALWWMSECVPIPVTALLPLVLAPLMGIESIDALASAYGHPLIFLFLGGFLVSIAMERTSLHLRLARVTLLLVGENPKAQIAGVMGITAFMSMWMSNTATTLMMLPIALSLLAFRKERAGLDGYGKGMLLGIAYSASIGGIATLIGTPPNAFLAAYMEKSYGVHIGFGQWMLLGVPLALILLVFTWFVLTRGELKSIGGAEVREKLKMELRKMGPLSQGELTVLIVFLCTAFAWIFRPYLSSFTGVPLTDTGIALMAGCSLFLFPMGDESKERVLEWKHASKLPWGVLLLFGGGLALAAIIQSSELDAATGQLFARLGNVSPAVLIAVAVLAVIALTEVTSNTATTATLLPLLTPVAVALGGAPAHLAIPVALGASCAFMMPVATPPNAIVFGSGELEMKDLMKAGFILNIASAVVLIAGANWVVPYLF